MFTKVGAIADIHAPFFGPVFSWNLQFLKYFIENKALQAFYFSLTLFRAGSGITLWGRAGQILPTSSVGYINPLNDLFVLRIYSQVNILDISSP